MRLCGAMIFVKDLNRMAAFYHDVLGLMPIAETRIENYVEFVSGPATFALHAIPAEIAAEIVISDPPKAREQNPVKLSFEADIRRLRELGVTIIERPWGAFDGVDPEGNVFGIDEVSAR